MPQNAFAANTGVGPGGSYGPSAVDSQRATIVARGKSSALNITAAAVVKATPGRVAKVVIVDPGATGGTFTLNDVATVGAAATANRVWTLPFDSPNNFAGNVFDLDWPFANGIVVGAVPTGGTPQVSVSFN
jgi:hypothetical protein